MMLQYNKKYGPLVREQFGPRLVDSVLSIFDIEAVETLHRYDGKYPRRIIIQSWQDWRDESPYARGIFIELVKFVYLLQPDMGSIQFRNWN